MPATIHGRAVREQRLALEDRDPTATEHLGRLLAELRDGRGPADYVDAIFQKWEAQPTDLDDAFVFGRVDHWVATGRILLRPVLIGERPHGDRERDANNATLARCLPPPFSAEFYGGAGEGDGWLKWDEPIAATRYGADDGDTGPARIKVEPQSAILEVGYTAASRTYAWLTSGRALARWPYRSGWITLFIPTPEFRAELVDARDRVFVEFVNGGDQ